MSWADNSVKHWRTLPISNPKPDLHNINAHTKFGATPLMFTQVIMQKRKMDGQIDDWQMDEHTDLQRETIIPRRYRVAEYKKNDPSVQRTHSQNWKQLPQVFWASLPLRPHQWLLLYYSVLTKQDGSDPTVWCADWSGPFVVDVYGKCPKISNTKESDKMFSANIADPDQTLIRICTVCHSTHFLAHLSQRLKVSCCDRSLSTVRHPSSVCQQFT